MTRSKKFLLGAIVGAVLGCLVGSYIVGIADQRWYTATGTVDMSDVMAIDRAFKDPTFTTSFTWGTFSLVGHYWPIAIPAGLALAAFVLILVAGRLSKKH